MACGSANEPVDHVVTCMPHAFPVVPDTKVAILTLLQIARAAGE
jgi:hypothetical protein